MGHRRPGVAPPGLAAADAGLLLRVTVADCRGGRGSDRLSVTAARDGRGRAGVSGRPGRRIIGRFQASI